MAQIHWLNQISADFNTAADWSTGTVPGANDTAILNAAGSTPYTVTASTSETVFILQLAKKATLAITGGVFTTTFGQDQNAGVIAIGNGATFNNGGGTFVNSGTIALEGIDNATTLAFPSVMLTGGGTISLSDSAENDVSIGNHGDLTNVDNTIVGSGTLTGKTLQVINDAGGVIDADNKRTLTIHARNGVSNAGLIESTGKGHLVIIGSVDNTGTLEANGGVITVRDTAGGSGSVVINAGRIDFQTDVSQNVSFTGTSGKLELDKSETYAGSITGFSKTGRTSLDLGNIGFVSSSEATFSGTATSGVLTVTDGHITAHITLIGDYTASTFVASSDDNGGTIVVTAKPLASAPAHRFIAAAAGLGGSAGEVIHAGAPLHDCAPLLTKPHAMIA